MSDMDYEKKYKEALERTKYFLSTRGISPNENPFEVAKELSETAFPELKESEDEKVEKAIFAMVYDSDNELWSSYGVSKGDVLAWLEKRAEPKEINPSEFDSQLNRLLGQFKSLPKEELASSLSFYLNVVQNDGTYKEEKQGEQKPNPCENCSIATNNCQNFPCTIRDGKQKPVDKVEPKFKVGDIIRHKEQGCTCKITAIDTATAEYGVSECSGTHLPFDFQDAWELVEQKPAEWSEKDDEMLQQVIADIEDLIATETGIKFLANYHRHLEWLKSLKDRVLPQPKQEWSEEDNEHIKSIISTIECSKAQFPNSPAVLEAYNSDLIWLKSLRPQSHWKPSEEQMIALKCAITTADEKWVCMNTKDLESLYEDLKKLREE